MIRPFALALCLSSPALADCLPEGSLPAKLTYDSGAVVEVDHDGHRGALCTPDHARDDVGSDVLELVGVNLDDHRRGLLRRGGRAPAPRRRGEADV